MKQDLLSIGELAESLNVPKLWVYFQLLYDDYKPFPYIAVDDDIFFKFDAVLGWLIDRVDYEDLSSHQRKEE